MKKLSPAILILFILFGPLFGEASIDLLSEQNDDFSLSPISFDIPEGYELADLMEDGEDDFFSPLIRAGSAQKNVEEHSTEYEYDSLGRIAKMTESGRITCKEYDLLDRVYDPFGNISCLQRRDPFGSIHLYENNTIHYTYTHDSKDRPLAIRDLIHHFTAERTYDSYGNLASEVLGTGYMCAYTYDSLGRPLAMTLPDKSQIHYIHNADQLIAVERIAARNTLYSHEYCYDLAGNIVQEKHSGQAGMTTRRYDLLHRPIKTVSPHWQEVIPSDGYDDVGNLCKREVLDAQGSLSYRYTYDALYQLRSETGAVSHTYQHDSLNNRVIKDEKVHNHNALNQLLAHTDCQYRYDANGNLIEKTSTPMDN